MNSAIEKGFNMWSGVHRTHGVVLFVDIRCFTELTERLGAEKTLDEVNVFYDIVQKAVGKNHGWIHNKLGDGVLCFFGFDERLQKQAKINAVIAALDIQASLTLSSKTTFNVGIGVSSGVLACKNNIFIGEPINLAARLSSLASGGQILVCEKAKPAENKRYRVGDLVPITMKNPSNSRTRLMFPIEARASLGMPCMV